MLYLDLSAVVMGSTIGGERKIRGEDRKIKLFQLHEKCSTFLKTLVPQSSNKMIQTKCSNLRVSTRYGKKKVKVVATTVD